MNHYFESEHAEAICMEAAARCLKGCILHQDEGLVITTLGKDGVRYYISPSSYGERTETKLNCNVYLQEVNENTAEETMVDWRRCNLFNVTDTARQIYDLITCNRTKIKGELL